jgi:hypothetical protein
MEKPTDPTSSYEEALFQERIRQARLSFTLAFLSTIAGVGGILFGPLLMYFGPLPASVGTTGGGLAASALCGKLAKDANDRLDKLAEGMREDD